MRENAIEAYLHKRVREMGGEHRRVQWIGRKHAADDLILLPGRHLWVECKKPGEKPRPGQVREHERLRVAGIHIHVVSTYEEVDEVLK